MSAPDSGTSSKDERVNRIIADYLQAIERGEVPDRAALLAGRADLADELSAFFADHDRFQKGVLPLANALTLPPSANQAAASGPMIRYFGDYELLEEIARGGMGVVYKARQMSLNRPVALKMILAGELATPEARRRFRLEAEAAANLQHPNIVAIHEVGEHEGRLYFSMDFVAGKNLAEIVHGNPLPAGRAASYVKTIAEAVHSAHQRGTLHRDLKPQNVLIDADDRPRITDFGLAKRVETDSGLTRTGDVLGSPSYMPPEQAESRPDQVGPHSDVYSLGAILYELLTGRPPFRGATSWETICQVLQTPPTSLRKLNPDVPPDLETICLKCLEKQPERRYHSARELAEELGRFLNDEPIQARPISFARRATFCARRHPWVIAAMASLLVLGLAFVSYGLWAQNRFLVWLQSHPDYVRAPGPWTARLEAAFQFGSILSSCLVIVLSIYQIKRVQDRGPIDARIAVWLSPPPPSARWLVALSILGGAGVVVGLVCAAIMTEAYVWGGLRISLGSFEPFLLLWLGLSLLLTVAEDSKRSRHSSSGRALSPDDEHAVRQAVQEGNLLLARILYRRKVPGASAVEAREYVTRVFREWEAQHPGEIAANFLSRSRIGRIRPRRLIVGWLIESVMVGALVASLPAPERARWMFAFLGSQVAGIAFAIVLQRVSGRRRYVISVAASLGLMLGELICRSLDPEHYTFGAVFLGFFAGIVLFRIVVAKGLGGESAIAGDSRAASPE